MLEVQEELGSFDAYLWGFVDGEPIVGPAGRALGEIPAETAESEAMSKDLKRRGFRFVGPTICYAFMQAAGLVERPRRRLLPLRTSDMIARWRAATRGLNGAPARIGAQDRTAAKDSGRAVQETTAGRAVIAAPAKTGARTTSS